MLSGTRCGSEKGPSGGISGDEEERKGLQKAPIYSHHYYKRFESNSGGIAMGAASSWLGQ